jgi:hypothetical protein
VKDAFSFLQLVTKRFPPIPRHAHSLILYGGKPQLNLITTSPCVKICFDVADLEKDPATLVEEITKLMTKDEPPPVT